MKNLASPWLTIKKKVIQPKTNPVRRKILFFISLLKAKKKNNKKPRYPKGFDPENPGPKPNPERWLPKYERKEFKNKKKY